MSCFLLVYLRFQKMYLTLLWYNNRLTLKILDRGGGGEGGSKSNPHPSRSDKVRIGARSLRVNQDLIKVSKVYKPTNERTCL